MRAPREAVRGRNVFEDPVGGVRQPRGHAPKKTPAARLEASALLDQASLDAVAGALTHLDVSSCRFLDAKALGALVKLDTANLANCGLESLAELEPALALCAKLRHLDVRGNPLAKDPRHAARVAVLGEGLRTVNGVEVTTRERLFLARLERRRERTSRDRAGRRLGPGDETRARKDPTPSLRRVNSHQHHQQHLETIANLGEGTVDHGFDYPGPVSPRSPGDLLLPGSPGATPLASPAGTVPGGWRDFPSPTGAPSLSPGASAKQLRGLQGTLDGTGTFHDGPAPGAGGMAIPGMASPRAAPGMMSPGMRNAAPQSSRAAAAAAGRGAREPPPRRRRPRVPGWRARRADGTAYAPPRQASVELPPSGADVTSGLKCRTSERGAFLFHSRRRKIRKIHHDVPSRRRRAFIAVPARLGTARLVTRSSVPRAPRDAQSFARPRPAHVSSSPRGRVPVAASPRRSTLAPPLARFG